MKKYLPLIVICLFCLGGLLYVNFSKYGSKEKKVRYFPYYGEKTMNSSNDTVYHTVAAFSFINQLGDTIKSQNTDGKNYVAEFFFTTCKSICPIMNKNMMLVSEKIKGDKEFKILSHTVKPYEDSVPVLYNYAQQHNADNTQWYFLTGNKEELYHMARYSYLVTTDSIQRGSDEFVHTQLFVLVDKDRHIRNYYDGTSEADVRKLILDIDSLKKEQRLNSGLKN